MLRGIRLEWDTKMLIRKHSDNEEGEVRLNMESYRK